LLFDAVIAEGVLSLQKEKKGIVFDWLFVV